MLPSQRARAETRRVWTAFLVGVAVTVALTALLTWGAMAPRYLLYRDFVTVPDPVLNAAAFGAAGAPRSVPLDLVTALAAMVAPSWLIQKILMVAPLLFAGSGTSFLLRHRGVAATIVASVLAVWNPYVAERLLLGQSPTLLGYAMIPWLLAAVRSERSRGFRIALVTLAALPALLTPVGGVMALLTVIVAAASLPTGRRVVDAALLGLPVLGLCLPWILSGLSDPTRGAMPAGATAFGVATDSPGGVIGSVLTLGGVWAPSARLDSRATWLALVAEIVLVVVAVYSWWVVRRDPQWRRTADLGLAAYGLVVVVVLLVGGPALPLWRSLQQVPGVAMFRDTHRLLGFAAMSLALLCGVATFHLCSALARWRGPRRWLPTVAGVVTLVGDRTPVRSRPRGSTQCRAAPGDLPDAVGPGGRSGEPLAGWRLGPGLALATLPADVVGRASALSGPSATCPGRRGRQRPRPARDPRRPGHVGRRRGPAAG